MVTGRGVQVTLKAPLKPLQSLQSAAGAVDGASIAPDQNGALEAFTERFIMGGTSYRFVIPNSVTSIGYYAFTGCKSLTDMTVNSGNSVYDSRNNCNAIIETASNTLIAGCQNTVIPNSVTSIGDWAFAYCSNLTSVTIPNSVTSIGESAFLECSSLTSVTISNSVTSIGNYAFAYCRSLTSVTCLAETPPTADSGTFSNYSATLYVPAGSLNDYMMTYPWNDFYSIQPIGQLPSDMNGDMNGDGQINIADLTDLIRYILSHDPTGIDLDNADVNQDGLINIADVTELINMLLSRTPSSR